MTATLTRPPAGDAATPQRLPAAVTAARRSLASVAEAAAWTLAGPGLVEVLADAVALRAQTDELVARLAVEVEARGIPRDRGAASTPAYLTTTTGLTRPEAASLLARGRLVADARCEPTRTAWAHGEIGSEQAEVIGRAVSRLGIGIDPATTEPGQALLVDQAARLSLDQLKVAANRWVEVVDPDGTDTRLGTALDAEEHRARQQAVFRGRPGPDGIARFSGRLPNLHYTILKTALDALANPRRPKVQNNDDRGRAHTAVDTAVDAPAVGADQPAAVPYGQRLGLAFCELVEHLPTDSLPHHGATNATIVVTIDEHDLRRGVGAALLDTGGHLSAGQVRRLACNAHLIPAVLGGDSAVLDLGTTRRLFNRHQRHALALRDRGCIWPGCDRAPAWCEAHHISPWSQGGPTDLANGVLLCSFHHHLIHANEGWDLHLAADGIPEIIPPERLDPTRTPIRHERLRTRPKAERTARAGPVHRRC